MAEAVELPHGLCAVVIQHLAQQPRHGSQVMTFGSGARQQLRHGRNGQGQSAGGPVLAGTVFTLHPILHMGLDLEWMSLS